MMEMTATQIRRRMGERAPSEWEPVWRCGWCKGFISQRRVSDMRRWVHDSEPATSHEVLPYRER